MQARHFVLAAGGLENPRLLLASTSRFPHGVGNQNDLVGRYFLAPPVRGRSAAAVQPEPVGGVLRGAQRRLVADQRIPRGGRRRPAARTDPRRPGAAGAGLHPRVRRGPHVRRSRRAARPGRRRARRRTRPARRAPAGGDRRPGDGEPVPGARGADPGPLPAGAGQAGPLQRGGARRAAAAAVRQYRRSRLPGGHRQGAGEAAERGHPDRPRPQPGQPGPAGSGP